ncbi:hypothetical protein Tco_1313625 [Tanacetum coccineum]
MVLQEKKTVAIEDSNSKALVATDNNEDIDWTKEFDAEPTTFAMMALTEAIKDDDKTPVSSSFNGYKPQRCWLDDFKVKLEKWTNASVLQNEVLNKQRYVSDKSCIGFGIESSSSMESDISSGDETLTDSVYENFKREKAYKAVPPPTGTIIPPRANISFTRIDELAIRNKVVNQEKTKSSQPEIDRNAFPGDMTLGILIPGNMSPEIS